MEIGLLHNNSNVETKVVYTVDDIKNMLGIGKNQAYALVNSGEFHVCHIGKKIIIPKIVFNDWLVGNIQNEESQNKIVS